MAGVSTAESRVLTSQCRAVFVHQPVQEFCCRLHSIHQCPSCGCCQGCRSARQAPHVGQEKQVCLQHAVPDSSLIVADCLLRSLLPRSRAFCLQSVVWDCLALTIDFMSDSPVQRLMMPCQFQRSKVMLIIQEQAVSLLGVEAGNIEIRLSLAHGSRLMNCIYLGGTRRFRLSSRS